MNKRKLKKLEKQIKPGEKVAPILIKRDNGTYKDLHENIYTEQEVKKLREEGYKVIVIVRAE